MGIAADSANQRLFGFELLGSNPYKISCVVQRGAQHVDLLDARLSMRVLDQVVFWESPIIGWSPSRSLPFSRREKHGVRQL